VPLSQKISFKATVEHETVPLGHSAASTQPQVRSL
jgi:hypothetical protein